MAANPSPGTHEQTESPTQDHARNPASRRARVVIVGAGFAGGSLVRHLPPSLRRGGETLLIDASDTFTFAPLIHEVAVGRIHPDSVVSSVGALCEGRCASLRARVTGVDTHRRLLETSEGPVGYEYLVLANGSGPATSPSAIRDHVRPFHTLRDALRLRSDLNEAWRHLTSGGAAGGEPLTVAVVGGGATGVEVAAEVAALFDYLRKRTPRRPATQPRVVLLEATNRLLGWLDPFYHDVALEELARLGVEVRLGSPVEGATRSGLRAGGEDLAAEIRVWATGVEVPDTIRTLPADHDPSGRVLVDEHLTLPGHPEVYVLGDNAAYDHPRRGILPPTASVAVQQGPWAARDLARRVRGAPPESRPPFSFFDRGYAVSLGPESAVADPLGVRIRGVPAQALYRGVLLFFQRSRRGRAFTTADWAMERTIGRLGFDSVLPGDAAERSTA